jgi:hypothetical protein
MDKPSSMSFVKRLSRSSSLTERQLEALMLYGRVLSGELTLAKASQLRQKPSKIGAFYRVVQQAKGNMREAVMTLTAGIWLGYVNPEDLRRLLDVVASSPPPADDERADQVLPVLEALAAKIVQNPV